MSRSSTTRPTSPTRDERLRLAAWAEEALGPLDILVNNAGIEFGGPFGGTTQAELEAIVAVNLLAVMDLTRLILPGMLERSRGHVVNIASLAGKVPRRYLASYAATKHGVVGFTHALRAELGTKPVGFSAICPASSVGSACTGGSRTASRGSNPIGTHAAGAGRRGCGARRSATTRPR